ncbi:GPW/gp25 family protein [Proteus mirabilis]|uniref:GPW/gp25 family protein n=1 Tax=Proteus mirabilis TaxID=584 RepID=UPI0034D54924
MNYLGMNSQTGERITDIEHVRQSIKDIFYTPIGSRLMRREYGSLLADLIDGPVNAKMRLQLMSACYTAVYRWEPRIVMTAIDIHSQHEQVIVDITGYYAHNQQPINFSLPVK